MIAWDAERIAAAAGARLIAPAPRVQARGAEGGEALHGPARVTIDSRDVGPGDLFVGLAGEHVDGGAFAADALAAGAWGVLVAPEHAEAARRVSTANPPVLLAADDPLAALQALATAWRRDLGAKVIGITGSTGKTSTKDILRGMLRTQRRTVATPQNLNTEIGLPLTVLGAPGDTEVLVLEMGMRGEGQIAELARIAEPDVGVIVSVGPVHLELLGTVERVAAAKAELLAGLPAGGTAVVPAGEPLLAAHLPGHVAVVTFGEGGDVDSLDGIELPFDAAHLRRNAMAAVAAARAVGVEPSGVIDVELSDRRGQRHELPGGVVVVDDCYNANPMSMRAALDELARAPGRRVAVLGDMLELGADEVAYHEDIGDYARDGRADVLVTVGPLAAHMRGERTTADAAEAAAVVAELMAPGDTILVKASRGVGLQAVAEALAG
ncbi:MAG: UDP-N-acetylmuramoyl-tripeptide--D-alanyl-D-alanine ligase [Solirubrobacteraceae bacterium]|nr:UDP-N-acetylmuramoyl-tripeptide--D-alanyl-D-alanine ligase [Solirubrobacteraceae bacterium]